MKRIALLAIAVMAMITAYAQENTDVAAAFASAPRTVFPLLDTNTRLDMIDYFRSGMSTPSQNALEGKSQITELEPGYLSVKMTDSSTAQLVLLDDGKQGVVAVINTVATPGLDSSMKFYLYDKANAKWGAPATKVYFTRPGWKEWMTPEGKSRQDEVEAQVPFLLVSYKYNPSTKELVLTNNLSKFLDKDIYDSISSYLLPQLVYTWDGGKFGLKR
ncbi:MAG: DUF3256 family protein [Duncaniella sp.]|nr:DUF3256 family protein [Duncaniella sp.]